MSGIKRTAADRRFSVQIRTRDEWTCQRCLTRYPENSPALDCAHMFGRRCAKCTTKGRKTPHECTRLDPDNAMALCVGCHFHVDGNPYEKMLLFRDRLGVPAFDALSARAHGRRDRVA